MLKSHADMIKITLAEGIRDKEVCIHLGFSEREIDRYYVYHVNELDRKKYYCVAFEDTQGKTCLVVCVPAELDEALLCIRKNSKQFFYSRECTRAGCDKKQPQKKCGLCRIAWYCCTDCQKKDWPGHKEQCARLAAARTKEQQGRPQICRVCAQEARFPCSDTAESGSIWYCGKDCQGSDWKQHRKVCGRQRDCHGAAGA
jgi:hypothetical protein